MRVGILCASDSELAPFLPIIDACNVTEKAMLKFYEGTINGVAVVALYSGVCKVNAAIAAQILIDKYGVDIMNPKLEIFDSVISTEAAYHDVSPDILTEFHPWLDSVYFKADRELVHLTHEAIDKIDTEGNVYWGRTVTGEAFIEDEGRQKINEQFVPLTVDMETAAIAHVCYVNHIPFISIRTITDTAAHSGAGYFEENSKKASIIAKDITVALLKELYCKQ